MPYRATYIQTAKSFTQNESLSKDLRKNILDSSSLFGFRCVDNNLYDRENRHFLGRESIDYLVKSFQFYKKNPLGNDEMLMASWVGRELGLSPRQDSFGYEVNNTDMIKSMKKIRFFSHISTLYFSLQECGSIFLLYSDYESELEYQSGKNFYSTAADVLLHNLRKDPIPCSGENTALRINTELAQGYSDLFLIMRKIIKEKENGAF